MKNRKKLTILRTMAALLAACATAALTSCTENESKISDTVWGTTIPVSELGKETTISAETFKLKTEGKYYQLLARYCRWDGSSLHYIQTYNHKGLVVYNLEGVRKDGISGPYDGTTYYSFGESEMSIFVHLSTWKERKYGFEYNDDMRIFFTPIYMSSGMHLCRILYIDDRYIIAETDVYRVEGAIAEARRAASQADFVLLVFIVVKNPVDNFLELFGEADS